MMAEPNIESFKLTNFTPPVIVGQQATGGGIIMNLKLVVFSESSAATKYCSAVPTRTMQWRVPGAGPRGVHSRCQCIDEHPTDGLWYQAAQYDVEFPANHASDPVSRRCDRASDGVTPAALPAESTAVRFAV
jgi:hypothetical protein